MKTLSIEISDVLYKGFIQFLKDDFENPTQQDVEEYISNFLFEENNETGAWSYMEPNLLIDMFDIPKIKQQIADCQSHECVIICNNWSINKPKYTDEDLDNGRDEFEWNEMSDELGFLLEVNQYDDLIVDPYGLVD